MPRPRLATVADTNHGGSDSSEQLQFAKVLELERQIWAERQRADAMERSWSWRVTRPLRAVRRFGRSTTERTIRPRNLGPVLESADAALDGIGDGHSLHCRAGTRHDRPRRPRSIRRVRSLARRVLGGDAARATRAVRDHRAKDLPAGQLRRTAACDRARWPRSTRLAGEPGRAELLRQLPRISG